MDFIQTLVTGGIGAGIVTGLWQMIGAIITKRVSTPADHLASEDFAYKVIRERLEEANADRKVLTETVNYLREDARKRDLSDQEDFEREQQRQQLVRDLNARITDLERQISAHEARLSRLAEKVRRNEIIILHDIYDIPNTLPDDLEDTIRNH